MKTKMRLRPSTKQDASRLFELWEASVRATHHFLSEEDIKVIGNQVKDYVQGCSFFVVCDDTDLPLAFMGMTENKVDSLFVDPAHFGKGIGHQLISHALRLFPVLFVDVNEDNEKALSFYRKVGFAVIDRQELDDEGRPFPILKMRTRS